MIRPVTELYRTLGYTYKDVTLLELALTHRSCGKRNNERLEYLGDSILNFVIANALFHKFPEAKEGEMSRLRAKLVKGETLAVIGREWGLGDYLRLGSGELKSGGYRRDSILADAVEAIIGSIHEDVGFDEASSFVLAHFEKRLDELDLQTSIKDSKTRLQEFLQSRRKPLPEYQLDKVEGDAHDQTFFISCNVALLSTPTKGVGSSRRQAEQEAAKAALKALDVK